MNNYFYVLLVDAGAGDIVPVLVPTYSAPDNGDRIRFELAGEILEGEVIKSYFITKLDGNDKTLDAIVTACGMAPGKMLEHIVVSKTKWDDVELEMLNKYLDSLKPAASLPDED